MNRILIVCRELLHFAFAAAALMAVLSAAPALAQTQQQDQAGSAAKPAVTGTVMTADGVSLHYVQAGYGKITILAPMALYLAPALLAELSRNHRVVMFDPRNRGQSGAAPLERVSLELQIEDAETIRRALGLNRVAVLAWSGQGMEMAHYALKYPDRVSHLILISPVPPSNNFRAPAQPSSSNELDPHLTQLDSDADAGAFADRSEEYCRRRARLTALADLQDDTLIELVPDVCRHPNEWPTNLWRYYGRLLGTFGTYDLAPAVVALSKPVLVIHGTDDRVPFTGGEAWVACNPRGRILPMPRTGHFAFLEHRAQVVGAFNDFLQGRRVSGAYEPVCDQARPASDLETRVVPGAWFPRWSHDSRWLYFAHNDGDQWTIARLRYASWLTMTCWRTSSRISPSGP